MLRLIARRFTQQQAHSSSLIRQRVQNHTSYFPPLAQTRPALVLAPSRPLSTRAIAHEASDTLAVDDFLSEFIPKQLQKSVENVRKAQEEKAKLVVKNHQNDVQVQLYYALAPIHHHEKSFRLCKKRFPALYSDNGKLRPEIKEIIRRFRSYDFHSQESILTKFYGSGIAAS